MLLTLNASLVLRQRPAKQKARGPHWKAVSDTSARHQHMRLPCIVFFGPPIKYEIFNQILTLRHELALNTKTSPW